MYIKLNVKGIGWQGVEWINLAQAINKWRDFIKVVMRLRVQ
jgi:hypothetical protein